MNNKKIGITLVIISLLFAVLFFFLLSKIQQEQFELGCTPTTEKCLKIESKFSITHMGVGIITAALMLGIYLILFSKGEEAILKRLEEEKNKKLTEEKFAILLRACGESEQSILKVIKEQPGIEQNTLRLKSNLSKAKVSQILTEFEKKRILRREPKGKTFSIYISEEF